MSICHPSGATNGLPISFLETMPQQFHPPLTQYTSAALSLYSAQLKSAIAATANEIDVLKTASDDPSWLIAVDACKCHLQSGEIAEFEAALEYLDTLTPEVNSDTYEMIHMYIDEWDGRVETYRCCIDLIKYLEYAVNEGCIAQIYFTPKE
jgi:hypothetical protein